MGITRDKETIWKENVAHCKQLVAARFKQQMLVAKYATEVCEVTWGGAKKDYDEKFTVKRFAREIGINAQTLSNWMAVKKNVYDRLPEKTRKEMSFSKLAIVGKMVSRDTPREKVQKIADKYSGAYSMDAKLLGYLDDTQSILNAFLNDNAGIKLQQDSLEEILFVCAGIVKEIRKAKKGIKPVNHGLTRRNSRKVVLSAAKAFGIERNISITTKDQKVINFMKRTPHKFYSPTEIGMKVGKHNRSNASAWAYRTFAKLDSGGLVEKNEDGHYKLNRRASKL